MITRAKLKKHFDKLSRFLALRQLNFINIVSIIVYILTSVIFWLHLYLLDETLFQIMIIEFFYALILFVPYWIFTRIFIKLKFQRNLYLILAIFAGFSGLFASLMTKLTPNWGVLRSNIPFLVMAVFIGLLNIISMLNITVYFTSKRIINPFREIISQKVKMEEELKKQKNELSNFAHIMVHDIRTYLSSIAGYAQLMKEKLDRKYPQIIIDQVKHINKLLESSLKLADSGKLIDKKEKIDLLVFSKNIVDLMIPEGINVTYGVLPSSIMADNRRLYQVWKNVIENAIIHGKPKNLKIYSEKVEGMCYYYLENDGLPFPKKILDKFNNHFNTFDSNSQGLGLQIIKRIITAHSWDIKLENDPNPAVVIKIPLDDVKY